MYTIVYHKAQGGPHTILSQNLDWPSGFGLSMPRGQADDGKMDMRALLGAGLALWLGAAGLAMAEGGGPGPVVVELYTSQGCSSCPPADEILAELADRDDVIALALHVDYWDYIGWRDVFASPKFTERQRAYAQAAGARTIYTPQMIVGGVEHLVGARPAELAALIQRHARMPAKVALRLARRDGHLVISASAPDALPKAAVVQLVRYRPEETVEIRAGENAGRRISYRNIVTDWQRLGLWDGASPLALEVGLDAGLPAVVILQEPGPGSILAAATLR